MRLKSQIKDLKIIKEIVEAFLGVPLNSPSRKRNVVYARAVYFRLARDFTAHPLALIGGEINKDHATVIHGLKIFKQFKNWEENQLISIYHLIRRKLKQNIYFTDSLRTKTAEEKFEFLLHHYITLKEKYYKLKTSKEKIS